MTKPEHSLEDLPTCSTCIIATLHKEAEEEEAEEEEQTPEVEPAEVEEAEEPEDMPDEDIVPRHVWLNPFLHGQWRKTMLS